MTIKETEQRTGLARSHIRFYEKEKLIHPARNARNGYREYSEEDIRDIKKIAYLRTLGISVEDIRKLSNQETSLYDVIKNQRQALEQQLSQLEHAKLICDRMLSSNRQLDYKDLDVEMYVSDAKDYLEKNHNAFKLDTVSFFFLWGRDITWGILAIACFLAAVFSIDHLPAKIPIQWHGGIASSFADKRFIFAFPAACIIIRFALRPFLWRWLKIHVADSDSITDYIANSLCFAALSIEIFIILYVKEMAAYVTGILYLDTFVFLGLLLMAVYRMSGKR